MSKSFKVVSFATLQRNCCERHFEYAGISGKFEVTCNKQGSDLDCNKCDIRHCPKMKMIGNFAPVSFDQFQGGCSNRKFKALKNDCFYVTCTEQTGSLENRCNNRQCPIWDKECKTVEEFAVMRAEHDAKIEAEIERIVVKLEAVPTTQILSLKDLNLRMKEIAR